MWELFYLFTDSARRIFTRKKKGTQSLVRTSMFTIKKKIDPNQIRSSLKEACKQGLSVTFKSSERAKAK